MAQNQARRREARKPELIARAKVGNGWTTIGAAWRLRGEEHGFSVKLNCVPIGDWTGQFVLVHPLENDDSQQPQEGD